MNMLISKEYSSTVHYILYILVMEAEHFHENEILIGQQLFQDKGTCKKQQMDPVIIYLM